MPPPLNNWLLPTLKKARAVCEDSDRQNFAQHLFIDTVDRVHQLTLKGAHSAPPPQIERTQSDGDVALVMSWVDPDSSWHLQFTVRRVRGEKPRLELDFYGNPVTYSTDKPTDADIAKALHDYFESWRRR